MIDAILDIRMVAYEKRVTYKTIISIVLITMAVFLPQVIHFIIGSTGGVRWLPMYIPILIGGCLLGEKWGTVVSILSPFVSFLVTSMNNHPMPAAERLPFMMIELVVFSFISGLFSKKIGDCYIWVFPAVILAQICGRLSFFILVAITEKFTNLDVNMVLKQIWDGRYGVFLQIIVVPAIIISLKRFYIKENEND